jgi:hypothetical protein
MSSVSLGKGAGRPDLQDAGPVLEKFKCKFLGLIHLKEGERKVRAGMD